MCCDVMCCVVLCCVVLCCVVASGESLERAVLSVRSGVMSHSGGEAIVRKLDGQAGRCRRCVYFIYRLKVWCGVV
jgi:hypothetical protein